MLGGRKGQCRVCLIPGRAALGYSAISIVGQAQRGDRAGLIHWLAEGNAEGTLGRNRAHVRLHIGDNRRGGGKAENDWLGQGAAVERVQVGDGYRVISGTGQAQRGLKDINTCVEP